MIEYPHTFNQYITMIDTVAFTKPVHKVAHMGNTAEVFIEVRRRHQMDHEHYFGDIVANGEGCCQSCGVTAWSAWWVTSKFGGTKATGHAFRVDQDARWRDLMTAGVIESVQSKLGARVIALIDTIEPAARLVGTKGSVPAMERGLLVHRDYEVSA